VPCADGAERPYLSLDAAASTAALEPVLARVHEFIPWYSSVHRGAGYKSQVSTCAYEDARSAALAFAGRLCGGDDVAIICRNTTEALNHLAYRLRLFRDDDVVTTVAEHHANLLPWSRAAGLLVGQPTLSRQLRMGTFAALDQRIATRFTIKPMDLAESAAYLRHHLTLAGRDDPLLADDAIARLHRVANGLPRALNNAALIAAAAAGKDLVDDTCARKAVAELTRD